MKWNRCSEIMPGQEDDRFYNEEFFLLSHPGFIVIFNHGDDEPFMARAYLEKGRFMTHEWCHAYDSDRADGEEECFDKYQETYWDSDIVVTHWAQLYWPDDILDDEKISE